MHKVEKRKVAIFTGNRAEYGLQYPIIKAIAADERLEYFLLVSGAHLKGDFGRTLQEIKNDGFTIHAEVKIEMPHDTLFATAQAISSGVAAVSTELDNLKPDFLIVYADRFEGFAAVIAGSQMGIPTVHVEGGDYTEGGALDDSVRHAMTKLAHLHFTTNEQALNRVLRLGEESWRVFNVGFPAIDLINEGNYATPQEIYKKYYLDEKKPLIIFTQHSVATEFERAGAQVSPSLEAIVEACNEWSCQAIITYPNDDAGGRQIISEIDRIAKSKVPLVQVHQSLGRYFYHGVLNVANACIGNSSSGIKETIAFHCPCINIGSRQQGRLRGENVIDVDYDKEQIKAGIKKCLFDQKWKDTVQQAINPYGAGNAGIQIAQVLATIPINAALIQKKMTY